MKKAIFVFVIFCAYTISVRADDRQDVYNWLGAIRGVVDSGNINASTLARANLELQGVYNNLISGGGGGGGGGGSTTGDIRCISRDNDGREPYVLAVRDPATLQFLRLEGSVLYANECQTVASQYRRLRSGILTCASRDNDGRAPYRIATWGMNGRVLSRLGIASTLNECLQSSFDAIVGPAVIAYCASRDNDGRAPFQYRTVNQQNWEINRGPTFSTYDECKRQL